LRFTKQLIVSIFKDSMLVLFLITYLSMWWTELHEIGAHIITVAMVPANKPCPQHPQCPLLIEHST